MSRKKGITLDDVAKSANVSPITVSRAIRHPEMVSQKVRARVESAVKALGYVPNPAARMLATGRSNVIGVVIPSVTNNVFADVLRGIYGATESTAFEYQIANTRYSPTLEETVLRRFSSQKPAGLVVTGFDQSKEARRLLETFQCPVVQIMEIGENPVDVCVGMAHFDAAKAATAHLLERGYRKLGFLGARMDPRTQRRFDGFHQVAETAGCFSESRVVTTANASSVTLGSQLLSDLLARDPDVDAIFCNNDDLAMGAMFEAQRRRIAIPQQLGICGFNDLEMMAVAYPPLTSVRTARHEIGRRAVEIIAARQAGQNVDERVVDLGFEVVGRESTNRRAPSDDVSQLKLQ